MDLQLNNLQKLIWNKINNKQTHTKTHIQTHTKTHTHIYIYTIFKQYLVDHSRGLPEGSLLDSYYAEV